MIRQILAVAVLVLGVGLAWPVAQFITAGVRCHAVSRLANTWTPPGEAKPADATKPEEAKKGESNKEEPKKEEPKKEEPKKEDPLEKWKPGGLFGPPPPPVPPPNLTAILGDSAIINEQMVKAGDSVSDGSKIVEVTTNKVVLEKDGKRRDLVLFPELQSGGGSSPSQPDAGSPPPDQGTPRPSRNRTRVPR